MRAFKRLDDDVALAFDASPISQSRILLNAMRDKWAKRFTDESNRIIDRFIKQADKSSYVSVEESLKALTGGVSLNPPKVSGRLEESLKASTEENVGLIKSIQSTFHEKIQGSVMRSLQPGGQGAAGIFADIKKYTDADTKRAKRIAIDQTRKVTTNLNVERQKSAGVKKWRWNHSGGSAEPRKLHLALDQQVFSHDDLPIIDKRTGQRGYPGQLINCKCFMTPVFDFGDEE